MRKFRLVLSAALAVIPFAVSSSAQVSVGVAVGAPVVAGTVTYGPLGPVGYGPPDCAWGYYSYYPYACAPYGYYGPSWFASGVFIGVGPWYGWGWGHNHGGYYGHGWDHDHWGHGGYGGPHSTPYRGFNGGPGPRGGYPVAHPGGGDRGGFNGGHPAAFGGGFHGGGGGGFHGGGHGGGGHR